MKAGQGLFWRTEEPCISAFPSVVLSQGNALDMQILGPHPRPRETGTLGVEPSNVCLTSPGGDSDAHWVPNVMTTDAEQGRGLIFTR